MIEVTQTDPPINFEREGEFVTLYPVKCKHTITDVKKATDWSWTYLDGLKKLEVQWKEPREEVPPPLMKVPDHIIIRNQQVELGKATSYIQELEERARPKQASPEESAEVRKTALYQKQKAKIQELNKTIQRLKRDKDDLIIKIAKMQQDKSGI